MDFWLLGGALGGIGLFLLGMRLMTDGLKLAAGSMLRDVLAKWTRTRFRGLLSGALITGIVQSSSAVTVATIGFVNAGILTLGQAMWVIFGSNVGTTMTGWIVAIVGFDIRIEAFALPLLGVGMFLSLTGPATRRGAAGEALAGFGVFFLGIATLKSTFAAIGTSVELANFVGSGLLNDALMVVIGFALTTLVQSSSAVIAIALTAAAGGVLGLEAGAALVIGANIGTTSTAILAVLGATPNARRVAVSHVAFNLLTGLVAVLLLPVLLFAVASIEALLGLVAGPATTLALFHTVFNLLGVALIWPLSGRLERWLAGRFVTLEENESRPRYLDRNSPEVPALAVDAVQLELRRVADIALDIAHAGFVGDPPPVERLARRNRIIEPLNAAIIGYIQNINAVNKSDATAAAMTHPIRALWHFAEIADLGLAVAMRHDVFRTLPDAQRRAIAGYATLVAGEIDRARRAFADPSVAPIDRETTEPLYQRTKNGVLIAAAGGTMTAAQAEIALEILADMKAAVRSLDRAGKRMAAMAQFTDGAGARVDEGDGDGDTDTDADTNTDADSDGENADEARPG